MYHKIILDPLRTGVIADIRQTDPYGRLLPTRLLQCGDQRTTGRVREIVMRAGRMVDAVPSTASGAALEAI